MLVLVEDSTEPITAADSELRDRCLIGDRVGQRVLRSPGFMEASDHGLMAMGRKSFMAAPKKYPDDLRARAVRLYRESQPRPVIRRLAEQLGVHHEALRNWIRQDEADRGDRHDRPTTDMVEENRRLRQENTELRRINEVLRAASAYFASECDSTRRRS